MFFLLGMFLLFAVGCARQMKQLPAKATGENIPFIRVVLDENLKTGTLLFSDKYQLEGEEATYFLDKTVGRFSVRYNDAGLLFRSKTRQFIFRDFTKVEFIPLKESHFVWNNFTYSGKISFIRDKNRVLVINTLPLPDYLSGVVQYEIPTGTEEYYPAVLAQTVAARTYALYHIRHPASDYFDVYSDTRDQVYRGAKKKAPRAIKAINKTFGLALQNSAGDLSETQFHSTCGGSLDLERGDYDAGYPGFLDDSSGGSFNCEVSPLYRWVKNVQIAGILNNLAAIQKISTKESRRLLENGFELKIDVVERNPSGRITRLIIRVNDGKKIELTAWQVRRVFSPEKGKALPSTLFFFKSSSQAPDRVYLIGGGFGHGKGMCQWGAIGMALKKRSFKEILNFYYPHLRINKLY